MCVCVSWRVYSQAEVDLRLFNQEGDDGCARCDGCRSAFLLFFKVESWPSLCRSVLPPGMLLERAHPIEWVEASGQRLVQDGCFFRAEFHRPGRRGVFQAHVPRRGPTRAQARVSTDNPGTRASRVSTSRRPRRPRRPRRLLLRSRSGGRDGCGWIRKSLAWWL